MKKRYLAYLLGTFIAVQGASMAYSSPMESTRQVLEHLNQVITSAKKVVINRSMIIYYIAYFYPSLIQFVSSLTLDNPEEVRMLEELINLEYV